MYNFFMLAEQKTKQYKTNKNKQTSITQESWNINIAALGHKLWHLFIMTNS